MATGRRTYYTLINGRMHPFKATNIIQARRIARLMKKEAGDRSRLSVTPRDWPGRKSPVSPVDYRKR